VGNPDLLAHPGVQQPCSLLYDVVGHRTSFIVYER